uniref:Putative cytoplasm ovary overexpressed n=1 Tax=Rhipicephalus microplus TaxID=6941 RepID=A0A6M2CV73_RHIMP
MSVFSLKVVIKNLQDSREDEDDLDMDSYIAAYRELSKFFEGLGSLFGFINSDVKSKLDILDDYRKSDDVGDNYETLNSMIEYEKEEGIIADEKKPSGSRTLLRLHRALEFIAALFKAISTANDDASVAKMAKESYDQTLAKYHPWLIRKGASVAMLTLPKVQDIFAKALPEEKKDLRQLVTGVSEEATKVYNFTQSVYEENNILDLP